MAQKKQLRLALAAYSTGWNLDAWRLPEATTTGLLDTSLTVDIARTAERGKLDYIFVGSSWASAPDHHQNIARWESFTYAGYAAAVTQSVGLVVSTNTSFEHPYIVARQLSTVDNFSHGRAGLNLVTSVERAGNPQGNFGGQPIPEDSVKYERAREFTQVLRGLLASWDRDFVLGDKESGQFVRPGSWHRLGFQGKHFQVDGPLNTTPPVQSSIPIVHAGTSEDSFDYGAEYAALRFCPYRGLEWNQRYTKEHKARAAAKGRDPEQYLIMPGIIFYIGGTQREAREKFREIQSFVQKDFAPAYLSSQLGIDLDSVRETEKVFDVIDIDRLPADAAALLTRIAAPAYGDDLSFRDLYNFLATQATRSQPPVVGDAKALADWFEENLEAEAFDGVQLFPPYHRGPADLFVEQVVPELQRRGIFRREYEASTLSGNLGLE